MITFVPAFAVHFARYDSSAFGDVGSVYNGEFDRIAREHHAGLPPEEQAAMSPHLEAFLGKNHYGRLLRRAKGDKDLRDTIAATMLYGHTGGRRAGQNFLATRPPGREYQTHFNRTAFSLARRGEDTAISGRRTKMKVGSMTPTTREGQSFDPSGPRTQKVTRSLAEHAIPSWAEDVPHGDPEAMFALADRLRAHGFKTGEIARHLGISPRTIRDATKQGRKAIHGKVGRPRTRLPSGEVLAQLRDLFTQGLTVPEIARRSGLSYRHVFALFRPPQRAGGKYTGGQAGGPGATISFPPEVLAARAIAMKKKMTRAIHPAIRVRLARAAALWRRRYGYLPPEGHGVPGLPGGPPGTVPASHVVTYRHRDTGEMTDHFVHGTRGPYAAIESLKRAGHSVRGIRPAEPEEVEQYLDVKRTAKLVRLGWLRRYAPVPKPAPAAPRSVAYRPGIKPPAKVIQRPKSLAGGPGRVGPAGRKPVIGPRGKSALPIARPPRPGPVIGPSGRPVVPAFRQPPPRTPIGTSPVIGPSGKPIRPPLGGSKTSDFGPFLDPKVAHNLEYSAHILRNIFGGRKARRYAAYKAPAKGIAVRGSFYPGGEFLPNLDKFANPENARRGALKARARAARRRKKSGNALAMAQALGLN